MPDDLLRLVITALALLQLGACVRVVVDYRPWRMERHQAARYAALGLVTLAIVAGQLNNLHAALHWWTWTLVPGLAFGVYGTWSRRYSNGNGGTKK